MKLEEVKITNASGIFSSSFSSLEDWINSGVDGVVLKTATYKPRKGYEFPNVAIDDDKILQAMGLPNPGYLDMSELAKSIKKEHPETFVIYSFASGDEEEIKEITSVLEKNCDALEFNISCPHAKGLGSSIGYDVHTLKNLCETVKENIDKPFGLKMPYYPTDELLGEVVNATEVVDFYTSINSVGKAMMIGEDFGISNKLGGLSGPAIKPLAVGQVYRLRKFTDKFIFGCGGIVNRRDVAEFLRAGANGVQLGSGVLRYKTKKEFVDEARKGFSFQLKNYFINQGVKEWE
ncbi:MAG: hypothetical protein J7L45_02935 [Candidatus Aenigmarchaeota archaeon]|nr:hypothetical protein [Candidatus Aenigmarchaeota archaeon]